MSHEQKLTPRYLFGEKLGCLLRLGSLKYSHKTSVVGTQKRQNQSVRNRKNLTVLKLQDKVKIGTYDDDDDDETSFKGWVIKTIFLAINHHRSSFPASLSLFVSLLSAVWPDGTVICSIFGHLQWWKFAQWHKYFAKVDSKCYQIVNTASKIPKVDNFLQKVGEISSNLVTLQPSASSCHDVF